MAGANLKNILSFEKDYPNAKIILLEENYRSTKNILEAANEIIKKNKYRPDKNLFTKNKIGEKIGLYEALDENDEADFVATKILEIMDDSRTSRFLSLRPCAEYRVGRSARTAKKFWRVTYPSPKSQFFIAQISNLAHWKKRCSDIIFHTKFWA